MEIEHHMSVNKVKLDSFVNLSTAVFTRNYEDASVDVYFYFKITTPKNVFSNPGGFDGFIWE